MAEPTFDEVLKTQGTRRSDVPPWMSYAASLEDKLDPQLEEAVKQYSERIHEKSTTQNEEELCRQRELSAEVAKEYQWLHPSEYEDAGPRIGRIMHSSEFINKLRNECGVKCWYREHPHPQKLTLLISNRDATETPFVGCWTQYGYMPEYSIVRFDEHGIPLDEKFRGWRTCLLQLILKTVINHETADKVFGKATGPASERYLRTLYGARNSNPED